MIDDAGRLIVRAGVAVPLEEIEFRADTAGGPGGQHANRSSTRVELRFRPLESRAFTERHRTLLAEALASRLTADGTLRVVSARERSQLRNRRTALARLVADPEQTSQVFELIDALAGNAGEKLFQRFLREPEAARLLAEKPSLLRLLSDRSKLEAMPAGTLGREYARFMHAGGIDAQSLVGGKHGRDAGNDPRVGRVGHGARKLRS